MKYKLMTTNENLLEVKTVVSFFEWQRFSHTVVEDIETLRYTEGSNIPILFEDEMIVAKGMIQIVSYFEHKGLLLC